MFWDDKKRALVRAAVGGLIGVAVLIFGVICLVGATQEFIDGEAGRRSGAGLIGGLLMSIAGLWLTITGRNTWSRNTQTGGPRP